MQWKIRPGPSLCWAILKPLPRGPTIFSSGTRTLLYSTSQWLPLIPKNRGFSLNVIAGGIRRHNDHAETLVLGRIGFGTAHDCRVVRISGSGGEPLAPVDDPVTRSRVQRLSAVGLGRNSRPLAPSSQSWEVTHRPPAAPGTALSRLLRAYLLSISESCRDNVPRACIA